MYIRSLVLVRIFFGDWCRLPHGCHDTNKLVTTYYTNYHFRDIRSLILPYAQFFLFHLKLLSYKKLRYFLLLNPFSICRKAPKMMPKWAWLLAVVGVAVGSP